MCLSFAWPCYAAPTRCEKGDQFGHSVATGGDFDGDGVADVLVGVPCSDLDGGLVTDVGSARVYSGADGALLFKISGGQAAQHMGHAVAFLDDVDGDGRDEMVVGSSGWDAPKPTGGVRAGAGKTEVVAANGQLLFVMEGGSGGAKLGRSVAQAADLDGDGYGDLLVGAPLAKAEISGEKTGVAYAISGATGTIIGFDEGSSQWDRWGTVVHAAADVDQDGTADLLVSSPLADSANGVDSGVVRLISGADITTVLAEVVGDREDDNLGGALCVIGDLNADGLSEFAVGAPGADPGGVSKAGKVTVHDSAGARLFSVTESSPVVAAAFGASLAGMGDVNGDGVPDFAAAAPEKNIGGLDSRGITYGLSGLDGTVLWSVPGSFAGTRLGLAIDGGSDFDGDGVGDLVVGGPGDSPAGRRGAGSVRLISGSDGRLIRLLKGRSGPETRLFTLGWRGQREPFAHGYNRKGKRRGARTRVLRGARTGQLSLAVVDGTGGPQPGRLQLAIGRGPGGEDSTVVTVRADRRRRFVDAFDGTAGGYSGGVNVAAGDIDLEGMDEIVAVQAGSDDGNVTVVTFQAMELANPGQQNWIPTDSFLAYRASDTWGFQNVKVNADGAMVAVGDLQGDARDDIVVAPVGGVPLIRVFGPSGGLKAEWLAYTPDLYSGSSVAVGDLDGDGKNEVITAPVSGRPWIKAFSSNGTPFVDPGTGSTLSFFAFDPSYQTGARVTVADVDLDGAGEILVAPGPGMYGEVRAFNGDGTECPTWKKLMPFGPFNNRGMAIAATDRFLRR